MKGTHLYPGLGLPLTLLGDQSTTTIGDGEQSEVFSLGDGCLDFTIYVVAADTATGDVDILLGTDKEMTDTRVYDTIAITGEKVASWRNEGPMFGHFQIDNNSGQDIEVRINQIID